MIEKDITYADVARMIGEDRPVKPATVKVVANGFAKTPRIRQALAEAVGGKVEDFWPEKVTAIGQD